MGRMVRKQMYISEQLERDVEVRARSLGVTQAEVVRRALTAFVAEDPNADRLAAVERLRELWAESDAKGYGSGSGGRTWTREDLYERSHRR